MTYVGIHRVSVVQSLEGRFEESVIAYLFLVNILPILIIPMIWLETAKFTRVLNDWTEFEVSVVSPSASRFLKVTSIHERIFCPIGITYSSAVAALRQILYFKVSGRVLPLNTQTKALLISIILPALSCLAVIVTHLTMVGFNIVQASVLSFRCASIFGRENTFLFRSLFINRNEWCQCDASI